MNETGPKRRHHVRLLPGGLRIYSVIAVGLLMVLLCSAIEVQNLKLATFKARAAKSGESEGWELEGSEAVMNGRIVSLRDARLELVLDGGKRAVITSPACEYDDGSKSLRSGREIHLRHPAFSLDGVGYTAFSEEHRILVHSKVRLVIKNTAMGGRSIFQPFGNPEVGTVENRRNQGKRHW